jgi:glycosyltransferase involved in cell wall biosynthesis
MKLEVWIMSFLNEQTRVDYLKEGIESILNQSVKPDKIRLSYCTSLSLRPDFEDRLRDITRDVIDIDIQFSSEPKTQFEHLLELLASSNLGGEDIIVFMDDDDFSHPHRLEKIKDQFMDDSIKWVSTNYAVPSSLDEHRYKKELEWSNIASSKDRRRNPAEKKCAVWITEEMEFGTMGIRRYLLDSHFPYDVSRCADRIFVKSLQEMSELHHKHIAEELYLYRVYYPEKMIVEDKDPSSQYHPFFDYPHAKVQDTNK